MSENMDLNNSDQPLSTQVVIYTDGACSGNPGPGGWGATMLFGSQRREIRGGDTNTTNNRMELMAAIRALDYLPQKSKVDLHTDSTYVRKGITEWIHGWKKRGWKTAARKPVKNADLWQELDEARHRHDVTWHWVKGHAGHPENERADELAGMGLREALAGEVSPEIALSEAPPEPDASTAGARVSFDLHPRLAADTLEVTTLKLCTVRLMNDHRYPWLILVPRCQNMSEIHDLSEADSLVLMREIRLVSEAMMELFAPQKLNVGALGNIVPQLHIHIVARHDDDPAWPGPVWGHSPAAPYDPAQAEKLCDLIRMVVARGTSDQNA